jgi:hypothetical protein
MLKITYTAAGDIKLVYKDRTYILPREVYALLVQTISKDLLGEKDAKHG